MKICFGWMICISMTSTGAEVMRLESVSVSIHVDLDGDFVSGFVNGCFV